MGVMLSNRNSDKLRPCRCCGGFSAATGAEKRRYKRRVEKHKINKEVRQYF